MSNQTGQDNLEYNHLTVKQGNLAIVNHLTVTLMALFKESVARAAVAPVKMSQSRQISIMSLLLTAVQTKVFNLINYKIPTLLETKTLTIKNCY